MDALTLHVSQLRDEMRAEFSAVRGEMRVESSAVREEIRVGLDKVMNQARMLYEDHKAGLALIAEGQRSRRKRQLTK